MSTDAAYTCPLKESATTPAGTTTSDNANAFKPRLIVPLASRSDHGPWPLLSHPLITPPGGQDSPFPPVLTMMLYSIFKLRLASGINKRGVNPGYHPKPVRNRAYFIASHDDPGGN